MSKKYLKIHVGEFKNPTRDIRELLAAKEVGFEVFILSGLKEFKQEKLNIENYIDDNGFKIAHLTLPNWKKVFLIRMIRQYLAIAKVIKSYNADIISGHNIYALTMAYVSTLFMKKSEKPILIYDSHEFEIGRNTSRGKFEHFIILHLERFLARRCEMIIMPSEIAANEVKRIHKLNKKPLVVRSIPNFWHIDKDVIKTRREEILNKLNASEDAFICIYHGAIMANRGVEQLIDAISKLEDILLVVMGYSLDGNYLQKILNRVKETNIEDRFLLLPPVEPNRIWEYTGAANIGAMPIQPVTKSYEICLPNKFFETMQSETPILASSSIEMKNIIEKYNIGLVCDSRDVEDIKNKLEEMKNDKEKYKKYKENLKIAKNELCWENEKELFIKAFKELYNRN